MSDDDIVTREALDFVGELHGRFEPRRRELLARRSQRGPLDFPPETCAIREADWTVPPPPPDLVDRRVERCFRDRPEFVLPDRNDVTMTVPFMRAYTELLVRTCHRRGAHAMGGMAAFIPSRRDPEVNERALAKVRAADLLDVASTPSAITEAGLRNDVNVCFQYISFWLGGRGAAAIGNLMEDAATAEICRTQLWQWIRHGIRLADGRTVTRELVRAVLDKEMERIRAEVGEEVWEKGRPRDTREVFERVKLSDDFPEFLTLVAYDRLD